MDNKIKNNIFYSEDAMGFLAVFRQASLNNDKIIKQLSDLLNKGEYDKILVYLEEQEGSSRWNHTVMVKYECYKEEKIAYRWTSNYAADYIDKDK